MIVSANLRVVHCLHYTSGREGAKTFFFPRADSMDCPRCQLALADAEYEGQEVHFCGTCWGYWMTREQLNSITHAVQYSFDEQEVSAVKTALSRDGDANRQGSERDAVRCPVCEATMTRRNFSVDCPVKIDECDQHGLWLDTGEIKDLQVFIEQQMR